MLKFTALYRVVDPELSPVGRGAQGRRWRAGAPSIPGCRSASCIFLLAMDDDVLRAKSRWPDVPAAWGWLYLDRRGQWRLIDRGAPGFDPVADARGEPIRHAALIDFIARNYACTAQGQWFFQNGPQQVFVDLELAPIIFRVASSPTGAVLLTHTGERVARVGKLGADADGNVWALTDLGPGVLDDRQLATLLSHSSSAPSPPSVPSVPGAPSA
ncbi:MAG: DUF2946 family protein, partial [Acidobacteria bacterium]|nr:DUF2946 family protein [Acidobacteriota bacterium]